MATLPPPPSTAPPGSSVWLEWYRQLRDFLVAEGGTIPWNSVDKTGSNLTDIATRQHNALQSLQGGTAGEYYHLTSAQATDLTDGNNSTAHTHQMQTLSWEDLRFPANGINPPGAATDPTRSTTTGLLQFSGTANNVIAGVAQMPHGWKAETIVRPHLHLRHPTANTNVSRWKFEYDLADGDTDFTNAEGTYTTLGTISVTNPNNVNKQTIASFGDLAMTNMKESATIVWKITRLANTDALDNDTSAITLLEFDIHYQAEKNGTTNEIP